MPKPSGASSTGIFDKSYRKVSGWNGTIPKNYSTFFPAFGPGVQSNTSVIFRISNPFAG
jgi:hypothetical protein